MVTSVEDLILHITTLVDNTLVHPRDKSVIYSISAQLKKPLALTEKQGDLVIKILKNNYDVYKSIPNFDLLVNHPIFKYPFRQLDFSKTISLTEHDKSTYIVVKHPFDKRITRAMNLLNGYTTVNNTKLFHLNEMNIFNIVTALKDFNFVLDPIIEKWYEELKEIHDNYEQYLPLLDVEDEQLVIKNSYPNLVDYWNKNKKNHFVSDCILAKSLGLEVSNTIKNRVKISNLSPACKDIIMSPDGHFSMSENKDWGNLLDSIQQWPIIVMISTENNLNKVMNFWHKELNGIGMSNKDISVLFRSNKNREFNQYIKDNNLNNVVSDNTKVVILKNKIPKILYRINFYPRLIICDSMYYNHPSTEKLSMSHPFVFYYTNQDLKRMVGRNIAKL